MKKIYKHLFFVLPIAGVMLLLPGLVSFLPSYAGMGAAMLLFLIVDPLFALGIGVAAGWDVKRFWYAPLLTALLYWVGTVLFIAGWNRSILFYVVVYLFVGVGAMGIAHLVRYVRRKL